MGLCMLHSPSYEARSMITTKLEEAGGDQTMKITFWILPSLSALYIFSRLFDAYKRDDVFP